MSESKKSLRCGCTKLIVAASGCLYTGACETPYGVQFRDAALPNIQTGVHAILDGFVDGVFAAIEPEQDGDDQTGGQ